MDSKRETVKRRGPPAALGGRSAGSTNVGKVPESTWPISSYLLIGSTLDQVMLEKVPEGGRDIRTPPLTIGGIVDGFSEL